MGEVLHAAAGIAGLVGLAWLVSEARRSVPWRAVAVGIGLMGLLAILCLKVPFVKTLFFKLNEALSVLEQATQAGTSLVFGYLGSGTAPFADTEQSAKFVLAFRALPIVLPISHLSGLH